MAESTAAPDRRRRTFGPVVLAGLGTAGLSAFAGHQPWARGEGAGGLGELTATVEAGRVPAANALALVVLACWGVLLVTRGRVRRACAALAVLAAAGVVASVVVGWTSAPDGVRRAYQDLGVLDPDVSRTGWYAAAAGLSLASLATAVLALGLVRSWPEMGRRYDAPADGAARPAAERPSEPEERESLELWKSIDEGRDPTT
ncbi:Trp biosynthesis-associated membrane protein [Nocardioides flavescens]|uniref:Tryptophan-associated transmembrane protein (Trp_oprn_chp) n=1 Tax=Nocardioides flavescens TaxID=2691959 RepID=A0A6L7ESJ3_9ACTN|nr:hypothetical protein [Nocardioides flavescens]